MENKTISVVMCTYNGEEFIQEQLDSILHQSRQPDEIIILDDCSTDKTYSILQDYARKCPYLKLFRNEVQSGINTSFFKAIGIAKGDYIAISDQDDIWVPNKLELQLNAISDNLLCGGRSKPFATDGTPIHYDTRIPNYNLLRLVFVGSISGHTFLFSKELLKRLPNYSDISIIRYYDVILLLVAASYDSVVYLDEVLVNHRRYVNAATFHIPKDNRMTVKNITANVLHTFKLYRQLKPEIKRRLSIIRSFLSRIESEEPIHKDALRMLELFTSNSIFRLPRLSLFSIKHRDKIFFAPVKKNTLSALRAMYFPVSCSEYYRYLLNQK